MNSRYKTIRRVIITGSPLEAQGDALDWAYRNGYRVVRSGPKVYADYTIRDKFKVIAEKQI